MDQEFDARRADLLRRVTAAGWRPLAGAVAVVVMVVGGCLALRSEERAAAVVLPRAGPVPARTTTTLLEAAQGAVGAEIVVHAAGAVRRPGVYRMPAVARVTDLLDAAGGPGPGADLSGVNFAAPLSDGARVYFPASGEDPPPEVAIVPSAPRAGDSAERAAADPALLDLNAATAAELEGLPGIGPVTAAAIVEHRERRGPFASVEALEDVTGIGPVKLSRIEDLVTVAP
ncbi:MAG: ComEA family DNA-binding protein [bacterium]|nr:ComEA family DNA-binding protein [bacterium]